MLEGPRVHALHDRCARGAKPRSHGGGALEQRGCIHRVRVPTERAYGSNYPCPGVGAWLRSERLEPPRQRGVIGDREIDLDRNVRVGTLSGATPGATHQRPLRYRALLRWVPQQVPQTPRNW